MSTEDASAEGVCEGAKSRLKHSCMSWLDENVLQKNEADKEHCCVASIDADQTGPPTKTRCAKNSRMEG